MGVADNDQISDREVSSGSDHGAVSSQRPQQQRYTPRYTRLAHQSRPVRWLATAVLLLPPLLYLISFAVAMSVMQTPDFVAADALLYNINDTTSIPLGHASHASPWWQCSTQLGNETDASYFNETCVRRPATGRKGLDACNALNTGGPNVKICVKITQTAELYVAGAALSGCAFLVAAFYAIMAAGSTGVGPGYARVPGDSAAANDAEGDENNNPSLDAPIFGAVANNALGSLATLLALAAAMCLVMGQVLGYAALVIESSVAIDSVPITQQTRWYMSKGILDYTSAAYGLTLIGAFVALTACGLHR